MGAIRYPLPHFRVAVEGFIIDTVPELEEWWDYRQYNADTQGAYGATVLTRVRDSRGMFRLNGEEICFANKSTLRHL